MSTVGSRIRCVAVDHAGQRVAVGCEDGTVRLLTVRDGRIATLRGHGRREIAAVAFSPDGTLFSAAGGVKQTLVQWRGGAARPLGALRHLWCFAISPDATWLAAGGAEGALDVLELPSGRARFSVELPGTAESIAIDPAGRRIAVISGGTRNLSVIDAARGRLIWASSSAHVMGRSVAFTGDGRFVVAAGHEALVEIWRVTTGQLEVTLQHPVLSNSSVARFQKGVLIAGGELVRLEPAQEKWAASPLPITGLRTEYQKALSA